MSAYPPAGSSKNSKSALLTLVQWRVLRLLRSHEFLFALIALIVLAITTGTFGLRRYEEKIGEFQANVDMERSRIEQARMYVEIMPTALLEPTVNTVIADGGGELLASAAVLPGLFGKPLYWSAFTVSNPFLQFQSFVGFAPLAIIVLSLIGLLMSSRVMSSLSGISNLRVTMSFGVKRSVYLWSEHLALTIICCIPLFVATILLAVIVNLKGYHLSFLSGSLIGFLTLGVLAVSASVWCGLLVSSRSFSSRNAMLGVLGIWTFCAWIWPMLCIETASFATTDFHASESTINTDPEHIDAQFLATLPTAPEGPVQQSSSKSASGVLSAFSHGKTFSAESTTLRTRLRILDVLFTLSFITAFTQGAYAVCGTSSAIFLDLRRQCQEYNHALRQWHQRQIERAPDCCFLVTDQSTPIQRPNIDMPVIVRASHNPYGQLTVAFLSLVCWNLLFLVLTHVSFERRSLGNLP